MIDPKILIENSASIADILHVDANLCSDPGTVLKTLLICLALQKIRKETRTRRAAESRSASFRN